MKISIDHKTIRELMDKDPEFEIEVKKSILRTACNTMAKQSLEGETVNFIKTYINKQIENAFGRFEGNYSKKVFIPSMQLQKALDDIFKDKYSEEISTIINKEYGKVRTKADEGVKRMAGMINNWLDEEMKKESITEKSEKFINKKLLEIVNAIASGIVNQ